LSTAPVHNALFVRVDTAYVERGSGEYSNDSGANVSGVI
jgi:hypothetical protein